MVQAVNIADRQTVAKYVREPESTGFVQAIHRGGFNTKSPDESRVTIKHVHVDDRGGQAVIADNVQTAGQNPKAEKQSHEIEAPGIPDPQPVRSKDAKRDAMPIVGDD